MAFCYKGEMLLKKALKPANDSRASIPHKEWEAIMSVVAEDLGAESSADLSLVYNFCKHSGGNSMLADKDHSVAAMSRSMAVYFALLSLLLLGLLCVGKELRIACYLCGAIFLMILMWKRSERFYIIRYIRIIRTFYYQNIKKHNQNMDK